MKTRRLLISIIMVLLCSLTILVFTACGESNKEYTPTEQTSLLHDVHSAMSLTLGSEGVDMVERLSLEDDVLYVYVDFERYGRKLTEDEKRDCIKDMEVGIIRGTHSDLYSKAVIVVDDNEKYEINF